jgi:tellurite resistance protein TehA-like permease
VLWIAAMAWLALLVAAELRWPRRGYSPARWATAFPVGMYAACSFVTGTALGLGGITAFARVWVWIALIIWCSVVLGALRGAAQSPG